jgi:phosphotransferase system enzyme I (PtsI)
MAVDRGNQAMNFLYTPLHPSVLRMIKMVVEEGKRHKIPISVCGEMAADPRYTPLLVGLGVDELSVIPRLLPHIKEAVRTLSLKEAKEKAAAALTASLPEEVSRLFH